MSTLKTIKRILIDIGHPGHVHLFKNFAECMQKEGYEIMFTCRDKEFEIELLRSFNFRFVNFGRKIKNKYFKFFGLIIYNLKMLFVAIKFKPDIFLSHGSPYAAQVAFLTGKKHICFEDTGNWEQVKLYLPFTDVVLTSTCFPFLYGKKQIFYSGYHELAYLHPNFFTPDENIFNELDLCFGEKYFILRFVSWSATHDIGQKGLSFDQKVQLVELLSKHGKVFISCEGKLDSCLEKYRFKLSPEKIHHALAFAHLFIGEGVTMASESAILGTQAIYVNSLRRSYTDEQEKDYDLVCNFSFEENLNNLVERYLDIDNFKDICKIKKSKLISEKINVTAFLLWFVKNYPESKLILKNNPNYQYNFL